MAASGRLLPLISGGHQNKDDLCGRPSDTDQPGVIKGAAEFDIGDEVFLHSCGDIPVHSLKALEKALGSWYWSDCATVDTGRLV